MKFIRKLDKLHIGELLKIIDNLNIVEQVPIDQNLCFDNLRTTNYVLITNPISVHSSKSRGSI